DEYGLNLDEKDKKILNKYRLWIEQKKTCIYTGKTINLKELFDGSKFDFEHTIPESWSFDSELKNQTIADKNYNINFKGQSLPSQCPNYSEIRPRLEILFGNIFPKEK